MRIFSRFALFVTGGLVAFGLSHCTTTDDHADERGGHPSAELETEDTWAENSEISSQVESGSVSLKVEKVHFDFDRSAIKAGFKDELMEVASYLEKNPGANLRILGHCDERGTPEYNIALGQRRANSVKDYLVTLGVDASRLTAHSYGKEMLVDTSGTEEGHYENRRAEFKPADSSKSF